MDKNENENKIGSSLISSLGAPLYEKKNCSSVSITDEKNVKNASALKL